MTVLKIALERAIENEEFILHWQPIFDLRLDRIAGYESLARWSRGDEMIQPAAFLPALLGTELERPWVRLQLRQIRLKLAELPRHCWLSMNLSQYAIDWPDLPQIVLEEIWDSDRLVFEISENLLLIADGISAINLARMAEVGKGLAIDDFGTAYSNFLRLLGASQGLFRYLKLDFQIVMGCSGNPVQQSIIHCLMNLAADLSMSLVAEGVECEADLLWLKQSGVQMGQGYFLDKIAAELTPGA